MFSFFPKGKKKACPKRPTWACDIWSDENGIFYIKVDDQFLKILSIFDILQLCRDISKENNDVEVIFYV